jgi:hypothetical protein
LLLTGRDRAVLHSLRDMRCLTIEQVQRLHFPSLATARRRIRLLEQAGLVVRFRSPAVAVELIRPMRAGPLHDSPRRARPSALFLEHALAINDFRIAVLRSLDLRGDLVLTGFACDRDRVAVGRGQRPRPVLATLAAGSGSSARHLPDGAFVLRRGERSALFVLEIDRGTEVVGRSGRGVDKMIRAYLSAIASGVLLELAPALGVPATPALCRVLIVTTSQARVLASGPKTKRQYWGMPW